MGLKCQGLISLPCLFVGKLLLATMTDYHGFLNPNDAVAISFWIISIAMVAATVFFLMESLNVGYHWKTSMNVGALVTLVAAVHYFYMREYWVILHGSPILYRYIDWSITVPLQMIEFYLILLAVQPNLGGGMFWRLLLGTVAMLAFGYAGESKVIDPFVGFVLGMAGWGYILYEIFMGEAASIVQDDAFHCDCRLVNLSAWLLLRILDGQCSGQRSQLGVQPGRFCEQDCLLPCNLGICQSKHRRVSLKMSCIAQPLVAMGKAMSELARGAARGSCTLADPQYGLHFFLQHCS